MLKIFESISRPASIFRILVVLYDDACQEFFDAQPIYKDPKTALTISSVLFNLL